MALESGYAPTCTEPVQILMHCQCKLSVLGGFANVMNLHVIALRGLGAILFP